jgi:carbon-monoxide dehydrogenase small subunit
MKIRIRFELNGEPVEAVVQGAMSLLELLRENFGLTGAKEGCGAGECGACTVMLDGKAITSCIFPAAEADGAKVITVEGLSGPDGELDPVQRAFVVQGAVQCGFCTPGQVMSAKALLGENPHPSETEIRTALAGNLCRCTGYQQIVQAVAAAAEKRS